MLKSIKQFQIACGRSISVTYVVHALLTSDVGLTSIQNNCILDCIMLYV